MAVKTREEIIERLNNIFGENNSDEVLNLMTDIRDTIGDETDSQRISELENQLAEQDATWRKKYRDAFMSGADESFEEENKSITNTTEEEGGEYQTEQQYSNVSICFEYPAEWELEEHQGEDGCCVRISAPNEEDGTERIYFIPSKKPEPNAFVEVINFSGIISSAFSNVTPLSSPNSATGRT